MRVILTGIKDNLLVRLKRGLFYHLFWAEKIYLDSMFGQRVPVVPPIGISSIKDGRMVWVSQGKSHKFTIR
jgi:hypothetical protein